MPARRALIVDDSRTARIILRRMLEQHKLLVDTAESAEDALDYLVYERPSVIFMDHMMPGMDGFQAVNAIKTDPKTAMIPIMMYTSKDDAVYLGEARALGAVGVLNKRVQAVELCEALQRLNLLEEPPKAANQDRPAQKSVAKLHKPQAPAEHLRAPGQFLASDEIRPLIKRLLEEQRGKLRQDMQGSIDTAALQTSAEIAEHVTRQSRAGLLILLLLSGLLIVAMLSLPRLHSEVDQPALLANSIDTASTASLARPVDFGALENHGVAQLRDALETQRSATAGEQVVLYDALAWAINSTGEYGFNELALNDDRLNTLYELVSRLSSAGFAGAVRIGVHSGQFCLTRNQFGGYDMPAPDTPIDSCEIIGGAYGVPPAVADLQSVGFANFLSASPLVNNGRLSIQIVSYGQDKPLFGYPPRAMVRFAGAWNRIAQNNNRVELAIIPSAR